MYQRGGSIAKFLARQPFKLRPEWDGGQVIYERTESTENPKTGLKRTVTEKRLNPGDWRGHAYVLDRADRLAVARSESASPTGARPGAPEAGKDLSFLEIVRRAYELAHTRAPDPRALPPATIGGQALPLEPRDARSKQGPVSAGDA